jgi:hypothetical protein
VSTALYLRTAAAAVPLASRLPGIPGGGQDVPQREVRREVRVDVERLAAYARVCGFPLRGTLPLTYPGVLTFGLQLELMAAGDFPFGAVGLVHVRNEVRQRRAIRVDEPLELTVRATPLEPHAKGRTFDLHSAVRIDGEQVWASTSTYLKFGKVPGTEPRAEPPKRRRKPPEASLTWRLPGDLGRRYGAASGDRNPIHLHPLTAKAFGFPRAIAHGMWTKARCVAVLEPQLPEAVTVAVDFRVPILLPGKVGFGADGKRFAVTSGERVHLEGSWK